MQRLKLYHEDEAVGFVQTLQIVDEAFVPDVVFFDSLTYVRNAIPPDDPTDVVANYHEAVVLAATDEQKTDP